MDSYQVFNEEYCEELYQRVRALQDQWLNRSETITQAVDIEYYTIGASSYMDLVPDPINPYQQTLEKYNPILKENFQDMFDALQKYFTEELQMPFRYHPDLGLPGIHIFDFDFMFSFDVTVVHIDAHYAMIKWDKSKYKFDPKNNISFTIPIKIPQHGATTLFWDEYFDLKLQDDVSKNYENNALEIFSKNLKDEDASVYHHKLGHMMLHSGNQFHRVGATKDMENEDCRITIQGHAIKNELDGFYYAFW